MSALTVTNIKLRPMSGGNIHAFADVEFNDGELTVKSFPIVRNKDGIDFVGMPRAQNKKGEWYPTVFFSNELKKIVSDMVMDKYKEDNDGWGG